MVAGFVHWYKHFCCDVRIPVTQLLTFSAMWCSHDTGHLCQTVAESGAALVADNHGRDRVVRDQRIGIRRRHLND